MPASLPRYLVTKALKSSIADASTGTAPRNRARFARSMRYRHARPGFAPEFKHYRQRMPTAMIARHRTFALIAAIAALPLSAEGNHDCGAASKLASAPAFSGGEDGGVRRQRELEEAEQRRAFEERLKASEMAAILQAQEDAEKGERRNSPPNSARSDGSGSTGLF